jgi:hypothetical protein
MGVKISHNEKTFYTRDRREWVYLSGTRNPESALWWILYSFAPRLGFQPKDESKGNRSKTGLA